MPTSTLPVPLSYLLIEHKGEEPVTPFTATLDGIPVTVTAVLDKSVAYEVAGAEWPRRELARPDKVLIDSIEQERLRWRTPAKPMNQHYGRRVQLSEEELVEQTRRHEAKVLESKAQVARREAAQKEADVARVRAAAAERKAQEGATFTGSVGPVSRSVVATSNVISIDVGGTKVCKVCGLEKPVSAFRVSPLPNVVPGTRINTCSTCAARPTQRRLDGRKYGHKGVEALVARVPVLRAERDRQKAAAATAQAKLDAAQAKLDAAQAKLDAAQAKLKDLHDRLGAALA